MAPPNRVKILVRYQVAPAFDSPEIANQFVTLPLTFYDIFWLGFPPAETLWFYNINSSPEFFSTKVLPKLKQSLSYTLLHFLPLAGHLTWPSNSHKPIILYSPNDTVSLTVALSTADFDSLSGNEIRGAIESRPYVPELSNSDTMASVIALQITLFPHKGFCIGITGHHAVIDGKSTTMFVKAWAHMCKHIEQESQMVSLLPAELTPFYDREVIKDIDGLETMCLNQLLDPNKLDSETDPRSMKIKQEMGATQDLVRSTFELTREDIKMLRQKVLSQLNVEEPINAANTIHLSTFVLTCAYMLVCLVKARGGENSNKSIYFIFSVDARSRLDQIPENYFGSCVCSQYFVAEAGDFIMEENALAKTAKRISSKIKGLEQGLLFEGAEAENMLTETVSREPERCISVAGSTRFKFYGSDFGWGRPKRVEMTSIDRTGAFSLMDGRDGNGGVEIGVALKMHQMQVFASLFVDGLNVRRSTL